MPSMTAVVRTLCIGILALLPSTRLTAGQAAPASIHGTVQDQTGAVVPGVRVTLVDATGAIRGETRTDRAGAYVFDGVASGSYEIRAEFEGFKPAAVRIRVSRGSVTAPKIVLQVAGMTQEITVGEGEPLSTAASANRDAMTIDQETLKDLPIFDRDIVGTMSRFLDPAAIGSGGVTLVVDGMEARKVGVSPSAIQEVKINQDPYSAEFQRPGRGRIEVVTKAGTDAYHGSADFTFRDAHLNARDAFAPTRPPEQRRIYEGVFGGPIRGGKNTSFLFTIEKRDEDLQAVVYAATPTGIVNAVIPRPARTLETSATWTHQAGKRHTITLRANVETSSDRNQNVGGTTLPEAAVDDRGDEESLIAGHRWIVNQKVLSEFRLLVGREISSTVSLHPGPRVVVLDAFTAGGAQATQRSTEYHFQLTENVTYLRGRHLLKTGFAVPDFSRRGFDDATNREGTFTFASLDEYAAGRPFSFLQQRGDGRIVFLQQVYAAFVQDQITLTPHLSLGVGLRYDWQNIFADDNNFGPRVSFAYASGARTVVRGGAGWFYDRAGDGAIRDVLRSLEARLLRYLLLNPAYPDPFAGAASDATPPRSLVQLSPDIRIPYTIQYGVGIERQLRRGTTLAVNYLATRGTDLFRSVDVNAPPPPLYDARPNPAFGSIRQIQASGRQQTHSVQMMLRGRLAPRVQG